MSIFNRIGAVKHKYKVEFIIDKLFMELPLTEELSIVIKRGDHKQESERKLLRKGVASFGKEILLFQPVTMFYKPDDKHYLEKEGEIRLVIHTQDGSKRLGGVIKFDLSIYANDKCEYQREDKEFQKCPDKAKNTRLQYEVYMKFLRQSNSQTGSEFGALTSKKDKEKGKDGDKDKKKLNQTQEPAKGTEDGSKVKDKLKLHGEDSKEVPKDDGKSKNKTEAPKTKVYFDKEKNESALNDSLNGQSDSEAPKPAKPKKEQKNGLKVIGHKKRQADEQPSNIEDSKPTKGKVSSQMALPLKSSLEEDEVAAPIKSLEPRNQQKPPKEGKRKKEDPQQTKEQKPQPKPKSKKPTEGFLQFGSNPNEEPVDPYKKQPIDEPPIKGLRPTQRTQTATHEYYEQRIKTLENHTSELLKQRSSLSLKVTKLTQSLAEKQKQLKQTKSQLQQNSRGSTGHSKKSKDGGDSTKELELKLAEAEKMRSMQLLEHDALRNKYDQLKAQLQEQRRIMKHEMSALEEQSKLGLKQLKEDLADARLRIEKADKERKEYDKERSAYRKEIETKNEERKGIEERLKQVLDELTRKKILISEAMNSAAESQDDRLTGFLEQHFM